MVLAVASPSSSSLPAPRPSNEELLGRSIAESDIPFLSTNAHYQITCANNAFRVLLNLKEGEDATKYNFQDLVASEFRYVLKEVMLTGTPASVDFDHRAIHGETIALTVTTRRDVLDDTKTTGLLCFGPPILRSVNSPTSAEDTDVSPDVRLAPSANTSSNQNSAGNSASGSSARSLEVAPIPPPLSAARSGTVHVGIWSMSKYRDQPEQLDIDDLMEFMKRQTQLDVCHPRMVLWRVYFKSIKQLVIRDLFHEMSQGAMPITEGKVLKYEYPFEGARGTVKWFCVEGNIQTATEDHIELVGFAQEVTDQVIDRVRIDTTGEWHRELCHAVFDCTMLVDTQEYLVHQAWQTESVLGVRIFPNYPLARLIAKQDWPAFHTAVNNVAMQGYSADCS